MSTPTMPRALWDGANLDVEAVNDNLRALHNNIKRNQDLRYTTTSFSFSLDGMADTDGANGGRKFLLLAPKPDGVTNGVFQIVGVEISIYAAAGATWSLSSLGTTWGGVSVATAGATTEAFGATVEPLGVLSSTALNFTVTGASTIVRGTMIVTVLCDRGQQSTASFLGYTPTIFSSSTSTTGATLDAELTAAAAAVTQDTNAQTDLRVMAFVVRNLASGGSSSLVIPSGARTGAGNTALRLAVCSPVGATVTGQIASTSLGTTSASTIGGGVANQTAATANLSAADADDPGGAADDITLTISRGADGGAVAPLCYLLVWFS